MTTRFGDVEGEQFLRAAVRKVIPGNPFADLKSSVHANPEEFHYVPREDAERIPARIIHESGWAKQTTASLGLRPRHEVCCTLRRAVRQTMGLRRPTIGLRGLVHMNNPG